MFLLALTPPTGTTLMLVWAVDSNRLKLALTSPEKSAPTVAVLSPMSVLTAVTVLSAASAP